jgi:hypothetical protein
LPNGAATKERFGDAHLQQSRDEVGLATALAMNLGEITEVETGANTRSPSILTRPSRNSIDERWPSPVARKLMMKRRAPAGTPA